MEAPKPWPPLTGPRSLCQSCLPADRAVSWRLLGVPQAKYTRSASAAGVLEAKLFPCGADDVGQGNRASTGSCRNRRELRRHCGHRFLHRRTGERRCRPKQWEIRVGGRQWVFHLNWASVHLARDGRRADAMALRTAESGPLLGEHRKSAEGKELQDDIGSCEESIARDWACQVTMIRLAPPGCG